MEDAATIKRTMLGMGLVESDSDLDWLTDEYLANRNAEEKKPQAEVDSRPLRYTDYGNHFYLTNNGSVWNWDSGENVYGGNLACGRTKFWSYNRRVGDSYGIGGSCSGGYSYYILNIYN